MAETLQAQRADQVLERRRGSSVAALEKIQATWIRPGVVVHDPFETVDELLVDFAVELRRRGFHVRGYARSGAAENSPDAPYYIDLANGLPLTEDSDAALACLRGAMRENADLLVVGRFSACTEATQKLRPTIGGAGPGGLPLLTSIAGQCIHEWHSYVRHEGSMIAPDRRSLWNWWGPDPLYRDLALGVADAEVVRIACGPRWIMVEGPAGAGLAYLPRHPRELAPRLPGLLRESLKSLAGLAQSWDPLEAALGVAAINAHYNRFDLEGAAGNGVRRFRRTRGKIVVVGAFPGVNSILPGCAIIETDPRPGEYPPAAMDALLPGCGGAIVNSSALINRSLLRILRLAPKHRPLALIGPSTPLSARLHDYGVGLLGGFVVHDKDGLAAAVQAGALPREFAKYGRYVHIADEVNFSNAGF